jgi:hypothetical protein
MLNFSPLTTYAQSVKKTSVTTTFWSSGESWVKVKARSPYRSGILPNLAPLAREMKSTCVTTEVLTLSQLVKMKNKKNQTKATGPKKGNGKQAFLSPQQWAISFSSACSPRQGVALRFQL